VLRSWGQYFHTGNANDRFNQIDSYVWRRLWRLRLARFGRHRMVQEIRRWMPDHYHGLGLYRLRGTVRYPASPFWARTA